MKEAFKVLLLLVGLFILVSTYVLRDTYFCLNGRTDLEIVREERKLVLLWTPFFGHKDWLPPCGRCEVTSNRSLMRQSHALIMHWRDIRQDDLPPKDGPPVVLLNREAPPHTPAAHSLDNISVNLTATYRRDSDIYAPYGEIVPRVKPYHPPAIPANRSLVCWLVSNCRTPGGREEYVRRLRRHIDVQVYGGCGDKTCPFKQAADCYRWLSERCQFYLSFENSLCRDYATEKLYLALAQDNMVPVVLGGEDYESHLPPDSYVDASHFPYPGDLANHLRKLGEDPKAYSSLLAWKRRWKARTLAYEWLCTLCDRLPLAPPPTPRPPLDIGEWWFDQAECGHPKKRAS